MEFLLLLGFGVILVTALIFSSRAGARSRRGPGDAGASAPGDGGGSAGSSKGGGGWFGGDGCDGGGDGGGGGGD